MLMEEDTIAAQDAIPQNSMMDFEQQEDDMQQHVDLHIEFAEIHKQKRDHPKLAIAEYIQALDNCTNSLPQDEIQERTFLKSEQATWELIQYLALCPATNTTEKKKEATPILATNLEKATANHLQIAQEIIDNDAELKKQLMLIQWLEATAYERKELDSIAFDTLPRHGQDQDLMHQHNANNDRFVSALWTMIRSGKLAQARQACTADKQFLRAASLQDTLLYKLKQPKKQAQTEQDNFDVQANSARFLHMKSLLVLASNPQASAKERATYGALCGKLSAMLDAATSWEDYLWAYLNASVTYKIFSALDQCMDVHSHDNKQVAKYVIDATELHGKNIHTVEQILNELSNIDNTKNEAMESFHLLQANLMCGNLAMFAERLSKYVKHTFEAAIVGNEMNHLVRFAVHVHLMLSQHGNIMLKASDKPILVSCTHYVLQHYLQHYLCKKPQYYDYLAHFTSYLPQPEQVPALGKCLESITDYAAKKHIIQQAKVLKMDDHGIRTFLTNQTKLPSTQPMLHETTTTTTTNHPIYTFTDSQYDAKQQANEENRLQAIQLCTEVSEQVPWEQVNEFLRYLLLRKNFEQAKRVLALANKKNNNNNNSNDNLYREYCSYQCLIDCFDVYNAWRSFYDTQQPKMPSTKPASPSSSLASDQIRFEQTKKQHIAAYAQFEKREVELSNKVEWAVNAVLQFEYGWLLDVHDNDPKQQQGRTSVMRQLRTNYLFEILFIAYDTYFTRKQYDKCLHLAVLVADEHCQLYKSLTKESTLLFMNLMKRCVATKMTPTHE